LRAPRPLECVPSESHYGCARNADRSNFTGLGLGPCSGLVRAYAVEILEREVTTWLCDGHLASRSV
jgi:hypothetical protein